MSEVFLVAARRLGDVPSGAALPWLLVVARNVIANQRRSGRRADAVWLAAVRDQWRVTGATDPADALAERDDLLRALNACTRPEREALLLVAWEGLTPEQAAGVAGCSVRAFTVRLSRARARLRSGHDTDAPDTRAQHLRLAKELS